MSSPLDPEPSRLLRAAALAYDREKDRAPRVVAQGRGVLAERILARAKAHGVPLVEDADLVELLEALEIGKTLPESLYRAVAEVLCFVQRVARGQGDDRTA